MKKNLFLGVIALMTLSCGSSKSALETQNQLLMMQMQQQQQQQQQQQYAEQRPSRTARTLDPCMEMAQADVENLRAYGTAKSYVEKTALNEAERDARNRMAYMIKAAVEGAAQDYERNANTNLQTTAETLGEAIMTQYVAQEIGNTRVIKTSIYDLADRSVEVYVCIEMRKPTADINEGISNVLDENSVLKTEFDRERFMNKMASGLDEYKKSISEN